MDVSTSSSATGGWKNLHAVNLLPQTFVAAGQPGLLIRGNVRTVADIAHQALLAYRNRPKLWDQWAALCGLGELRAKQIIRFDSLSAVVHAAERGVGIALASAPLTAKRFADGTLRQIGPSLSVRSELNAARASWEAHVYGGVLHSFTNPEETDPSTGMAYDAAAARHCWSGLLAFLENTLS